MSILLISAPDLGSGYDDAEGLMASDIVLPATSPVDSPCARHSRIDSLLTQVGEGNREAFAALYDEVSPTVYAMSLREGQDPKVSAMITQYVFLRVWRQARSYAPGGGSAMAWVCAIACRATEGRDGYVF